MLQGIAEIRHSQKSLGISGKIYFAGNCGNQAFPEIPRHFWKCLGN